MDAILAMRSFGWERKLNERVLLALLHDLGWRLNQSAPACSRFLGFSSGLDYPSMQILLFFFLFTC